MDGTLLITGANSSLAIPAIEYLLSKYPNYTVVLTVRDTSETDVNTRKLRQIIEAHPKSTVTVEKLDLASLTAVASFADLVNSNISEGKWPRLSALVCNAFFWSLAGGPHFSKDGFELSLAVAHIAHMSLALRLLDSFSTSEGRVVFLGSEVHWPGRNAPMEQFPPGIPDDLEQMVHPPSDKEGEEAGRGFQRYGIAKLAVIMGMYELNKRLKESPRLCHITALALDPGALLDSRAFKQDDVPMLQRWIVGGLINYMQPVLRFAKPTLRRTKHAGPDLIEIAVGKQFSGKQGYFVMNKESASSPESQDAAKQKALFDQTLSWCGIHSSDIFTPA